MIYYFIAAMLLYVLSIIAIYYIARFMYFTNNSKGPIPPLYWIMPIINTALVIIGFLYCIKDIPIAGTTYWDNRWEKLKEERQASLT